MKNGWTAIDAQLAGDPFVFMPNTLAFTCADQSEGTLDAPADLLIMGDVNRLANGLVEKMIQCPQLGDLLYRAVYAFLAVTAPEDGDGAEENSEN
jgi:hypothetical protein